MMRPQRLSGWPAERGAMKLRTVWKIGTVLVGGYLLYRRSRKALVRGVDAARARLA